MNKAWEESVRLWGTYSLPREAGLCLTREKVAVRGELMSQTVQSTSEKFRLHSESCGRQEGFSAEGDTIRSDF